MEPNQLIKNYEFLFIVTGIVIGFVSRMWMLKSDVRQYPTLPNGYLIHLTTGFIAAAMGAVAYPALHSKNYIAVTILATAIQQFRDIRKMEKESLESLEKDAYVPRGEAYIDGIAKTFEARNYIVIIVSMLTTILAFILSHYIQSIIIVLIVVVVAGLGMAYLLKTYTRGYSLGDIVLVEEAPLEFRDNCNLYVGDISVGNIGLYSRRKRILENGVGIILKPKNDNENEKIILNHKGQMDAILHECSRRLGVERYAIIRRDYKSPRVGLMMVPIVRDIETIKETILNVPILETVRKVNQRVTKES
ncbi:YIEGIA family protein [Irregularibacter muris]|uniref:YIEGIA family protein n=1 Tax=Irregularibacter muris TaxID=1796619 RepID=A0AAE3L302_9FIRM|nr:YIEGIA family protein [Irregularibacter muris]MCR1899639.1 YIEGIA family protein [Irregularibacter muris]